MAVRTLTCNFRTLVNGSVGEGLTVTLYSEQFDNTGSAVIVVSADSTTTDANGDCSFSNVIPNTDGGQANRYRVTLRDSDGVEIFNSDFQMPDADSSLHNLIDAGEAASSRSPYLDADQTWTGDNSFGDASTDVTTSIYGTLIFGDISATTTTTITAILDEDNMASDSANALATQQSIKAYVDSQIAGNNELSEILANGNTTGANNIIVTAGQQITTDTINETTAAAGVTIDGNLLKDGGITLGTGGAFNTLLDDDTFATASTTSIATTESIKAYVDTVAAAQNEWSEILANGNISNGNNVIVSAGDILTADTINETTAAAGVTIDGSLLKDGGITLGTGGAFNTLLDDDTFATASTSSIATTESIKAYVDTVAAAQNEWSEILGNGNTSGGNNVIVSAGDQLTVDTINETTGAAGVTIDGVLLKDSGITTAGNIGVNTTATYPLDVDLNGALRARISNIGNAANAAFQISTDPTHDGAIWFGDNAVADVGSITYDHTTDSMLFATASTTALTIDSSQNVILADGASLDVDTINEATAAAGVTIDGVLLKDGGLTATADLNIADATHIYFSGSSGDYGRMGFTDGDPDVFVWEYYQNSGSRNYVEFTSTSEAAGDSLFNIGIGGSDVISITNASETSIANNLYVGPSATGAQLAVRTNASETTLLVDQDANAAAVQITTDATSANALGITANSMASNDIVSISGDGLTTGSLITATSNSVDTSTRNLVEIVNDNTLATGTQAALFRQDAASQGIQIDQNGTGVAVYVTQDSAGGASFYAADNTNTGSAIQVNANSLTTGYAEYLYSNSADTSSRNILRIIQDNSLATGSLGFYVQQDANAIGGRIYKTATGGQPALSIQNAGTGGGIEIDQDGNGTALSFDHDANSRVIYINSAAGNSNNIIDMDINNSAWGIDINQSNNFGGILQGVTNGTTSNAFAITGSGVTTGKLAYIYSNSADTSSRNLVEIVNDNTLATGTVGLVVRQDSSDYAAHFITSGGGTGVYVDQQSNADALYVVKGQTGFGNLITASNGGQGAALFLDQNGNGTALSIDSESTTANVLNLATVTTTANNIVSSDSSLTTGRGAYFYSNSADTNTRNLVSIVNDNALASTTYSLYVQNDGAVATARTAMFQANNGARLLYLDQNGDEKSIFIDAENTTSQTIDVDAAATTGTVQHMEANALTSAQLQYIASNSADTNTRNLVEIVNDNALATGTTVLSLQNDSSGTAQVIAQNGDGHAMYITKGGGGAAKDGLVIENNGVRYALRLDQNANSSAISIDSEATTASTISISSPTTTTATAGVFVTGANALTVGAGFYLDSDSADTGTRSLLNLINDNTLATGSTVATFRQDAAQRAVFVDQNANSNALQIDGANTTAHTIQMTTHAVTTAKVMNINLVDSLTTGGIFYLASNSADTGTRSLLNLINDNTLATGSTVATFRQDAAKQAVFVDQNANSAGIVIDTEATSGGEGLYIGAPTQTGADVILVSSANSLTTGSIFTATSNSADTSTRYLAKIVNDNALASNATLLDLQQDGDGYGIRIQGGSGNGYNPLFIQNSAASAATILIDNNGNAPAIQIDHDGNGHSIDGNNAVASTANIVRFENANSLTTGGVINISSNSADTNFRSLVSITNDNSSATGTSPLTVRQDAVKEVMILDQNAIAPFVDFRGTSAASAAGPISTWTTGNSVQGFIAVEINGTERWMPYYDAPTS